MKRHLIQLAAALAAAAFAPHVTAAPATISVRADQPGRAISPLLWGIFFEDINLAADGGLYPELVRNRSFEGSDGLRDWSISGAIEGANAPAIDQSHPLNAYNRSSLHVRPGTGIVLENTGYWGMNLVAGETYTFRIAARGDSGLQGSLKVELRDETAGVVASGDLNLTSKGQAWNQYSLQLVPSRTTASGKLRLSLSAAGDVFLDMISLIPEKTWKGHGLRGDLAEAMNALKPAFFRFPGGCWVEGDELAGAFQWKYTIGDVASRTTQQNLWDYLSTNGIGYHEYLQLAEDLGAEPVFCINVGMAHHESAPLDRIGSYIQDALDAIEYANGPVDSVWGSLRAKNGHPAPFNLRIVEIGNEDGGPDYAERWPLFVKAIKARYPEITLIANYWKNDYPKEPIPEIIDVHIYDTPRASCVARRNSTTMIEKVRRCSWANMPRPSAPVSATSAPRSARPRS